jgi:hypothetical protein
VFVCCISECGTYSTPAAVQISDRRQMVGTATAALSGDTFYVTDGRGFSCSGSYDALDNSIMISAPVIFSDGRIGTITLNRTADRLSGSGTFVLNDGMSGQVAFGKLAPSVLTSRPNPNIAPPTPAAVYSPSSATTPRRSYAPSGHYYIRGPRGGCYYISSGGSKEYVARSLCG